MRDDISDAKSGCGKYRPDLHYERCEPYLTRKKTCPDCPVEHVLGIMEALGE